MTPLFTINFRREAWLRERARARARVLSLGLWLAYFGVLGVVLGLYGLNCASLVQRTRRLEGHVARLRALQSSGQEWRPQPADVAEIERFAADPAAWRARLSRLPALLPANARLTALHWNPDNVSGGEAKFVLAGRIRANSGEDRMQNVMAFVQGLASDSVFSRSFRNVRLVTTRASESGDVAEFVIECR